ncbi:helicase associated domain-containing protein, partial [Agromyces soli]
IQCVYPYSGAWPPARFSPVSARAGGLADSRRRLLDAFVVGWADDEREWRRAADRLARHVAEHGRFPSTADGAADARALARWVQRQRRLAELGELPPARERWLDRQSTGWRDRGLAGWQETMSRLERFRAEHGRLPARAGEASALERELGVWLANQRAALRGDRLAPERARLLDERLPEWRDARLAAWLRRAHEVAGFFDERGRLPSPRSTHDRSRELGGWLDTQRRAARRGTLESTRLAWLDARLPGWAGASTRVSSPTGAAGIASPTRTTAATVVPAATPAREVPVLPSAWAPAATGVGAVEERRELRGAAAP